MSNIIDLQDSATPVTSISFPAVTICTEGLDMDAVGKVIFEEFTAWKQREKQSITSMKNDKVLLDEFMKKEYAIKKDENIFDMVRAMNSPNPDKSMAESSVLGSVAACARNKEDKRRKKRNAKTFLSDSVTFVYQEAGFVYYKVAVTAGRLMTKETIRETCTSHGMRPVCQGGLDNEGENLICQRTTFMPDTPRFLVEEVHIPHPEKMFLYGPMEEERCPDAEGIRQVNKTGQPCANNLTSGGGDQVLYALCVAPPGRFCSMCIILCV